MKKQTFAIKIQFNKLYFLQTNAKNNHMPSPDKPFMYNMVLIYVYLYNVYYT